MAGARQIKASSRVAVWLEAGPCRAEVPSAHQMIPVTAVNSHLPLCWWRQEFWKACRVVLCLPACIRMAFQTVCGGSSCFPAAPCLRVTLSFLFAQGLLGGWLAFLTASMYLVPTILLYGVPSSWSVNGENAGAGRK